jgi:hypothetical protein
MILQPHRIRLTATSNKWEFMAKINAKVRRHETTSLPKKRKPQVSNIPFSAQPSYNRDKQEMVVL